MDLLQLESDQVFGSLCNLRNDIKAEPQRIYTHVMLTADHFHPAHLVAVVY